MSQVRLPRRRGSRPPPLPAITIGIANHATLGPWHTLEQQLESGWGGLTPLSCLNLRLLGTSPCFLMPSCPLHKTATLIFTPTLHRPPPRFPTPEPSHSYPLACLLVSFLLLADFCSPLAPPFDKDSLLLHLCHLLSSCAASHRLLPTSVQFSFHAQCACPHPVPGAGRLLPTPAR